jgi:hypothetical protein
MNIDWKSLEEGVDSELQKSAASPANRVVTTVKRWLPKRKPSPPPVAAPSTGTTSTGTTSGVRKAVNTGAGLTAAGGAGLAINSAYDKASNAVDGIGSFLEGAKGLLPLGLTALLGGGGGAKGSAYGQGANNSLASMLGRKPNILDYNTSDVHTLSNPSIGYNMPKIGEKRADITDLVAKAVQQRAINSVLDKVTTPTQETTENNEHKKVELTSEHPEIADLLKDKHNKAYLEKLLNASQ